MAPVLNAWILEVPVQVISLLAVCNLMVRKKIGIWRKLNCPGILCGYGFHYDAKKDRTYCYGHGWVMNGNIEGFPMSITEDDFDAIIESVKEKGVKFREV